MRSSRQISRRKVLRGMGMGCAAVRIGLPPLEAMFNPSGTAYAAPGPNGRVVEQPAETRFVLWFNGNGIPERYWIPSKTGDQFEFTPCLSPLAKFRSDIHILTGLDNPAARMPGVGNDHHRAMSALATGTPFTGRGAGGPSFDQLIASSIGDASRFRSLQIGVCNESHGDNIHRNLSWAGYDRALPPEMIPRNLFDRIFGAKESGWIKRKKSVIDAVQAEAKELQEELGGADRQRLDEHLSSIRDLERAITSLPPDYADVQEPDTGGDLRDYPRIAKIQSELLVHALATRQTRVASYMLTKCQSLVRMPWLGYTALRHHDYTHTNAESPQGQRILRDICKWHVEEFAYFVAKLKSVPEGEKTLLDNCCLLFLHEHAEANSHKCNGLPAIVAGHANRRLLTGRHTKVTGTVGDLYLTIAQDVLSTKVDEFPTGTSRISAILS